MSFPVEFDRRIAVMLNSNELADFKKTIILPSRKSIRVNILENTVEEFLGRVKGYNWQLTQIPWCPNGFFIDREDRSKALGRYREHQQGLFYIQEASSMLPVQVLAPKAGEKVADLAASPGSKTTQMAGLMSNKGFILANDLSSKRIRGLIDNVERLHIFNTGVCRLNALKLCNLFSHFFDKILLDAPCTGEGLIRKDPSIGNKWSLMNIARMAKLQKQLLLEAFLALKTGGELVYSTCTMSSEENEEVVGFLLQKYSGVAELQDLGGWMKNQGISNDLIKRSQGLTKFENRQYSPDLSKTLRIWPQVFDTEGFFVAKIKKLAKIGHIKPQIFQINLPKNIKILFTKELKRLETFIRKNYGYDLKFERSMELVKHDHRIILRARGCERFISQVSLVHNGISVFKDIRGKLILTHEGATLWGKYFTKQVFTCSKEQAETFLKGQDLRIADPELDEGTVVLWYDGLVLGKGSLKEGKLKNQLPRKLTN